MNERQDGSSMPARLPACQSDSQLRPPSTGGRRDINQIEALCPLEQRIRQSRWQNRWEKELLNQTPGDYLAEP